MIEQASRDQELGLREESRTREALEGRLASDENVLKERKVRILYPFNANGDLDLIDSYAKNTITQQLICFGGRLLLCTMVPMVLP